MTGCLACVVDAGGRVADDVVVIGHALACPHSRGGPVPWGELEEDCL